MIDQAAYERMRASFLATGTIDEELYSLLLRIVRGLVYQRALPAAWSPTGRWDDEAALDAAHGWIDKRLLRTNALLAAFDHASSPRPFRKSLARSFQHYLQSDRQRGEIDNLVSRTVRLLRDSPRFREWVPQAKLSDSWWGLDEWESPEPYQGSDDMLVANAWALGDVEIFRYSPQTERASPIVSTEVLAWFLEALLRQVNALVTVAHLSVVLRRRFDLDEPRLTLIDAAVESLPAPAARDEAALIEAALAVVSEFTLRQAEVLFRRWRGATLDAISVALEISRGTVDNELKRAGEVLARHVAEGEDPRDLLEKVLDALS
jgi:DNA-binding CsgD family transcriptional regulator